MWELKTKRGEYPDVTTEQVLSEIRSASVAASDQIRSEGTPWQSIGDIPEFRIAIERQKTQHTARLFLVCLIPILMLTCSWLSQGLSR